MTELLINLHCVLRCWASASRPISVIKNPAHSVRFNDPPGFGLFGTILVFPASPMIALSGLSSSSTVIEIRFGVPRLKQQIESGTHLMSIVMRDRSKNRKPLQKGRNLSTEAILTVQALKRAGKSSEGSSLEQVFENKLRRLLKFDMIAVLKELLRQNQCALALKVFEDVKKEKWYRPKLFLYAEMVTALGSNGLVTEVEVLIMDLKAESLLSPDLDGFHVLLESLLNLNLPRAAMECFNLMKSVSCVAERVTYRILVDGLTSNGELSMADVVRQEAEKHYGPFVSFTEEE